MPAGRTTSPDAAPTALYAVALGLVVLGAAIALSLHLDAGERRAAYAATSAAAGALAGELESRIEAEIRALARLGRARERHGRSARGAWEAAASDLRADLEHLQAIEWVDPGFRVRWIVPAEGNEGDAGRDMRFEERRRLALEAARDGGRVTLTRAIELAQGGRGFLACVPLRSDGRFRGFVVGVYRAASLGVILENVATGYDVRILDGDEPLFVRGGPLAEGALRREVRPEGGAWALEVAPGAAAAAAYQSALPWVTAAGGAVTAFVLALALYAAQTARWRAARLAGANARLSEEIAGRERAEAAERQARAERLEVLGALPDHVWSGRIHPDGRLDLRYYSDGVTRLSGWPASHFEAGPAKWLGTIHEADRERVAGVYRDLFADRIQSFHADYRLVQPDGGIRWVRDRTRTSPAPEGRRIDGIISDITELKRAEEERFEMEARFQQAQKLESLGVLAGGIAHDFNNLLVAVLGHARLALADLPDGSPAEASLRRIAAAARRAGELCRQMLAYAGRASFDFGPMDVRTAVTEIGELLSASLPKKVRLRYHQGGELPDIEGDRSQLRQLAMNLVTNAAEAIGEEGGTIEVSARACRFEREELAAFEAGAPLEPGPYVALSVRDDGCGMDEDTRRRMFDPFYTTKFDGRGLGLSAALGIVRAHHGGIRVESRPGAGTTVTLILPALGRAAAGLEAAPAPEASAAWRGHGTLLVVDDEEDAREVARLVLERVGFHVLTAPDGVEALDVFFRHAERIRCVVLDLAMPGLDGCETHLQLRRIRPDVPVVLCSGYPAGESASRFQGSGISGFLEKPWEPEALLAAVRTALGEAAGS